MSDISWDDEAVTTKLCNMMSSLEIVLMNVILLTGPYFPMSQFSGNWEPWIQKHKHKWHKWQANQLIFIEKLQLFHQQLHLFVESSPLSNQKSMPGRPIGGLALQEWAYHGVTLDVRCSFGSSDMICIAGVALRSTLSILRVNVYINYKHVIRVITCHHLQIQKEDILSTFQHVSS